MLLKFLPFLAWLPELRRPAVLRADVIAGVTVALVLIPQSMAYAQLAGLPAYYGLYAAFLPPLVAALFGSSRQLATGPVAVVSLMTAAALEPIAETGGTGYIAYAVLLAIMVGVFQVALGVLRLGVLVNFLSHPVVVGFTNAAAIIIATSQLGKIFGVDAAKAEYHYETVWNTVVAAYDNLHLPTLAMAVVAFVLMLGLRRISPRIPNVLIAVVITTLLSWAFGFSQTRVVRQAQLLGPSVAQVLADRTSLLGELDRLGAEIRAARKQLEALQKSSDVDEERLLTARHTLDLLELQRQRRVGSLHADTKELMAVHFVRVPGATPEEDRFYVTGHAPPEAEVAEGRWLITQIRDDGILELHSGGRVVGVVPSGLPSLRLPGFDWGIIAGLLTAALAISLIGFMEAIAIAKGMAARTKQRLDANQELIGQGLGNIVGGLFQSYPTAGSFSRSAVNLDTGAVTGFSSAVTSLVVVIVLMWLTPLLYHLPQATLAAVIMMAVIGLVRVAPIRHAWKVHRHDGAVAVITFALTLLVAPHLDKGILVGVVLSLGLYLYRTMKPRVVALGRRPDGGFHDAQAYGLETCENIAMLRFDGSLYFANTSYFEDKVLEKVAAKPQLRFVIVDAEGINQIDATGEEVLVELAGRLREAGIELLFSRTKKQVLDVLERSGFMDRVGRERFFWHNQEALQYAWSRLGPDHAASCPLAGS